MKNLKSYLCGALTAALFMGLAGSARATTGTITRELEYRNITVTLNGKELDLRDAAGNEVEPFMFDGTNYVPVRAIAEALGLNVAWDGKTATIILTYKPGK